MSIGVLQLTSAPSREQVVGGRLVSCAAWESRRCGLQFFGMGRILNSGSRYACLLAMQATPERYG